MLDRIDFVVFDVETTGLNPLSGDRIIEIAAAKVKNGEIIDTFESFVNPQRDIPMEAQQLNNITEEMVKDAPNSDEVMPQMLEFSRGACMVGHNVKFDLNFLCFELSQIGRKLHEDTVGIDTLKLSRWYLPQLSNHKLSSIALYYGLGVEGAHRALVDVKLTATVFLKLLNMAKEQGVGTYQEICKEFSVTMPNFKINDVSQGSLF